jgi:uncharacterized membrane protein
MAEREFSPARLEAISDGVIAVAITIMVLELHAPHAASPAALVALWPAFASYVVSFTFIASYWVNHRYLFRHLKVVDDRVVWTNMILLFTLSLIPFSTAYVGVTDIAPFPTAMYAAVMLVSGLAYGALAAAVRAQYPPGQRPPALGSRTLLINAGAAVTYVLAIAAAYLSPILSLAMNFAVSLVYMSRWSRPEAG